MVGEDPLSFSIGGMPARGIVALASALREQGVQGFGLTAEGAIEVRFGFLPTTSEHPSQPATQPEPDAGLLDKVSRAATQSPPPGVVGDELDAFDEELLELRKQIRDRKRREDFYRST